MGLKYVTIGCGCANTEKKFDTHGYKSRSCNNEDINVKRKFITELHLACELGNNDELEANFQLAFAKSKLKKYERVATIPTPEE